MVSRYTHDSLVYGLGVTALIATLLGVVLTFDAGGAAATVEGGQILLAIGILMFLAYFALVYPRLRGR